MTAPYHEPVLTQEVTDALNVTAGKRYIDATLGGGGHATQIVKRGGILLGIDTDDEAIEFARARLSEVGRADALAEGNRWKAVQGNFRDIEEIARKNGFSEADGILFDLGVSSHQLDTKERGFSYRFTDAPLDLRLNQAQGETAAQLVNRISESELYEILATFGEEERARTISSLIVRTRQIAPITKTGDLVAVVDSMGLPKKEAYGVSSRIFQALRMAVNDELGALKEGLTGAAHVLVPGGRIAVISFHSLEDRIVKRTFREGMWKEITRKPIIAGKDEIVRNIRARSAKLRIAERQ